MNKNIYLVFDTISISDTSELSFSARRKKQRGDATRGWTPTNKNNNRYDSPKTYSIRYRLTKKTTSIRYDIDKQKITIDTIPINRKELIDPIPINKKNYQYSIRYRSTKKTIRYDTDKQKYLPGIRYDIDV